MKKLNHTQKLVFLVILWKNKFALGESESYFFSPHLIQTSILVHGKINKKIFDGFDFITFSLRIEQLMLANFGPNVFQQVLVLLEQFTVRHQ